MLNINWGTLLKESHRQRTAWLLDLTTDVGSCKLSSDSCSYMCMTMEEICPTLEDLKERHSCGIQYNNRFGGFTWCQLILAKREHNIPPVKILQKEGSDKMIVQASFLLIKYSNIELLGELYWKVQNSGKLWLRIKHFWHQ